MNRSYPKYLVQLAGISLLYCLLYYMMRDFLTPRYYDGFWKVAVFFYILFASIHFLRLKQTGNSAVRFFMASTTIKMFLMLIILTIYFFLYRETAISFAISFLIAYFVFMVFDVAKSYKLMKTST